MNRFLSRFPDGRGTQAINPLSLPHGELYLRSDLGIAATDGGNVNPWRDQSGNSRDGVNNDALAPVPIYHSTGALLSPSGKPVVSFNGLNAGFGSQLTGDWTQGGGAIHTDTRGMTAYFGGRWYEPVNAAFAQVIWQTFIGARPQLLYYDDVVRRKMQKIDTDFGGASFNLAQNGLHTAVYRFVPPKGAGAIAQGYLDGVEADATFPSWGWTSQAGDQYLLSGNAVQNVCCKVDLMWCLIYSDSHSPGTIAGVNAYLKGVFAI